MALERLSAPIVLAPLAGGPATVELAVAVSEAGGLGFLASGYRSAAQLVELVQQFRERSERDFGVNVFVPPAEAADPATYQAYVASLRGEAARVGVELGKPRFEDDEYDAKLAAIEDLEPPVASFVFGCPQPETIRRLQRHGTSVWVTVTTPDEASAAARSGADVLVAQGTEAGGHRGGWRHADAEGYGLLSLLQLVGSIVDRPLVAAGGIATGRGVAAALAAGARAAQVGSAFLLCPEAGTSEVHREALASDRPTAVTRAFTGKPARGVVNRFMREHGADAPSAYPEIHHVTAPLRRAGRERGDGDVVNLWAGQAHALAEARPAAEVVRELAAGARTALADAGARLGARTGIS